MDKNNPLLPFAFSTSSFDEKVPLNTTPRNRKIIDENASSMYHTRVTPETKRKGPTLKVHPGLKRKMGESFNEKDDIKRRDTFFNDFGDDPTLIDGDSKTDEDTDGEEFKSRDYKDGFDRTSESSHPDPGFGKKTWSHLPSSPTLEPQIHSEFDIGTSDYNVPDSPTHNFPSEINHQEYHELDLNDHKPNSAKSLRNELSSKKKRSRLDNMSSDADFGIDQFNRFKATTNCPPTDKNLDTEEYEEQQRQVYESARQIVIGAFEDMNTTIHLEGLGIRQIPEEIKDFDNLVIFDFDAPTQNSYQLYLTNNKIDELPPSLFNFTKLNVLGFRQNKLSRIPPLIRKLENLVDLSLGTNKLEYLPPQILDLPNLSTFRAGPNPYMKIPDDAIEVKTVTLNLFKTKKYFTPLNWKTESKKLVPSLKNLCLDTIANYDVTYQETKNWKKHTPKIFHSVIASAISKGQYEETCSECDRIVVEPVAESIEWWDFLQNKDVPIKRQFCSGMCAKKWERSTFIDQEYF